ncbi:MAG: hypothetical protein KA715_12360 [Xanthomonadaceae bacterium]|nr:hypothetical protein [Xanthomonadaceae bacterium]
MKNLILSLLTIVTLSVSAPRAQALSTLTWTTIGGLAVTAVAVYLVASDTGSVQESSKNKEAAMNVIAEDAAIFIMNEGEGSSELLRSLMSKMRESDEFKKLDEQVTDLELAHVILDQTDTESN